MATDTLQTLAYYTAQSQAAIAYVKSKMSDGAGNSFWDLVLSGGDSLKCVLDTRKSYNTDFSRTLPISEQVKLRAEWAELSGCGNCGEQSAMAYEWLRKHGAQPAEWMHFSQFSWGKKDHAFVVLGRAPKSSVSMPSTWGDRAVVCDAWDNKTYPAKEMNRYWPGSIPELWEEP